MVAMDFMGYRTYGYMVDFTGMPGGVRGGYLEGGMPDEGVNIFILGRGGSLFFFSLILTFPRGVFLVTSFLAEN